MLVCIYFVALEGCCCFAVELLRSEFLSCSFLFLVRFLLIVFLLFILFFLNLAMSLRFPVVIFYSAITCKCISQTNKSFILVVIFIMITKFENYEIRSAFL